MKKNACTNNRGDGRKPKSINSENICCCVRKLIIHEEIGIVNLRKMEKMYVDGFFHGKTSNMQISIPNVSALEKKIKERCEAKPILERPIDEVSNAIED